MIDPSALKNAQRAWLDSDVDTDYDTVDGQESADFLKRCFGIPIRCWSFAMNYASKMSPFRKLFLFRYVRSIVPLGLKIDTTMIACRQNHVLSDARYLIRFCRSRSVEEEGLVAAWSAPCVSV